MFLQRFLVGFFALVTAATAYSETNPGHYGYAELAYSLQNTDWGGYGDSNSSTTLFSLPIGSFFHLSGRYNDGDVSLPQGFRERHWWSYGAGLHHYFSKRTSIYLGTLHHEVAMENARTGQHRPTQRGYEYHVGIRHDVTPQLRLGLEAGKTDVIFKDPTFTVEALYQLPANLAISLRLRDYEDLDLTEYEAGLRWQFD